MASNDNTSKGEKLRLDKGGVLSIPWWSRKHRLRRVDGLYIKPSRYYA